MVSVERRGDTIGRVVLKTAEGDERVVEAGMGVLRAVVGSVGWVKRKKNVIVLERLSDGQIERLNFRLLPARAGS